MIRKATVFAWATAIAVATVGELRAQDRTFESFALATYQDAGKEYRHPQWKDAGKGKSVLSAVRAVFVPEAGVVVRSATVSVLQQSDKNRWQEVLSPELTNAVVKGPDENGRMSVVADKIDTPSNSFPAGASVRIWFKFVLVRAGTNKEIVTTFEYDVPAENVVIPTTRAGVAPASPGQSAPAQSRGLSQ